MKRTTFGKLGGTGRPEVTIPLCGQRSRTILVKAKPSRFGIVTSVSSTGNPSVLPMVPPSG